MELIGNVFLHLALVVAVYAVVMAIVGGKTGRPALVRSARNAVWGVALLVLGAADSLVGCFLTGKYYVEYVYEYSNSAMPTFYKVASLWGGQNGSLLFWLLILCGYSSVAMLVHRKKTQELFPYVIAT